MMKRLLLLAIGCFLAASQLNAKILRVNNNYMLHTVYANGQIAHDAAQPGDTLYFESSSTVYPAFTVTKRLVIMGLGTFLNTYEGYQVPGFPEAAIAQINVRFGADNTTITGVKADINANGVAELRLYRNHGRLDLNSTASVLVYHNYITRLQINQSNSVALTNNFIGGIIEISANVNDIALHQNTINGNVFAFHSYISNNILVQGSATLTSCSFKHNVLSSAAYYNNGTEVTADDQNNVFGALFVNIFEATAADDRYYQLKSGSPAKGAGLGGVDCGFTGGTDPYAFSALQPSIPSIYKLDVPGVASGNSMQVTISTRVNK